MSVRDRQRRLPISCEPCRLRKIRCSRPRGPPPCETCERRGLASDCLYAGRNSTSSPARPILPPSPLSERATSDVSPRDEGLAARVAKLEALLQAQAESAHDSSESRPTVPLMARKSILSVSKSGHVRFTPSPAVDSSREPLQNPQQAIATSIDLSSGPFPFGKKAISISELLDHLPARSHCKQLVDVYYESFASLFHILHEPTFNDQYAEFEQAPETIQFSWLALLFAILGTAVTALDSSSQLLRDLSWKLTTAERISELSEKYRTGALKCLEADNYLWQQNVTTLQALIILIYGINHSHGQTWTLLGVTYHVALSIGCHVDPCEFGLDVIKSEERRRCWAGVMMLYMLQNTSLGHLGPDPRHASEGVRLPADLNDSDLVPEEWNLPPSPGHVTQMSYLLLKFRLYEVASDIRCLVLNVPQPSPTLIDRMDKVVLEEQSTWSEKYLAHSTTSALPMCHEAHVNVLYGYAHQLTLLLHHKSMRTSSSNSPQYLRSMIRCIESAKELLHLHKTFFSSAALSPFGWYLRGICSFHAFHAAVTLVAVLTSSPWGQDYEEILSLVQGCADRFETMVEVSSICEKAAPVLRLLVNTVETWSIGPSNGRSATQLLNGNAVSRTGPFVPPPTNIFSDWPGNDNMTEHGFQASQSYVDDVLNRLDPQLWLAPSPSGWNQWSSLLNGINIPTGVV